MTYVQEHGLVPLSQLWQPLPDLQFYKVVGVVGRVMLVIDSRTHYLFIIKVSFILRLLVFIYFARLH